jgi:hypothetical protein
MRVWCGVEEGGQVEAAAAAICLLLMYYNRSEFRCVYLKVTTTNESNRWKIKIKHKTQWGERKRSGEEREMLMGRKLSAIESLS